MVSHILYGTQSLIHGGLLFEAWAAGDVAQLSLEIVAATGPGIVITVVNDNAGIGSGAIRVELPIGTTEKQFLWALSKSAPIRAIVRVVPKADGTNLSAVVALLVPTDFDASDLGLVQWLEARLGILGWGDRDLNAEDKDAGILWCSETGVKQVNQSSDGNDVWEATFVAGIAFQTNSEDSNMSTVERAREFIAQNALLDLFRMQLYAATRLFEHKWMVGDMSDVTFGFANTLKDETLNTILPNAHVRAVGNYKIQYEQPSFQFDILASYQTKELRIGLWRNPVTDVAGSPDSVLDTQIHLEPQD